MHNKEVLQTKLQRFSCCFEDDLNLRNRL